MDDALDEAVQLRFSTGRAGGADLTPSWSRSLPFWSRPERRHALELGAAIFALGLGVTCAAAFAEATGAPSLAPWLAERGPPLVILAAVLGLHLLRLVTTPLRLRRARAAVFGGSIVVAAPDLLGLIGGGEAVERADLAPLESYRDLREHVCLYRGGAPWPALRVPVHDEAQRTQLLAFLDERGLRRRDG